MKSAGKSWVPDAVVYLAEATRSMVDRRLLVPAVILLLVVTASNIAALLYPPVEGSASLLLFSLILLVRVAALFVCSVAIFRLAAGSSRGVWTPDGGFLLYLVILALLGLLPTLLKVLLGDIYSLRTILLASVVGVLIVSLFAPWIVAAAVQQPLAWHPTGWLRRFDRWMPHRLLWALLLIVPLAVVQQLMPVVTIHESAWFWPLIVAYSVLGFVALMIRIGLDVAAYRRVAQD